MNASKEKQRLPSPDGESCSICLEAVESRGERSVARLKCGHLFHLDCIGSAFNAKGAMQCPNCRQVECGQWLYSSGGFVQQEELARSNYGRIQFDMVYLSGERQVESMDLSNEASRQPSHSYGHGPVSQGEDDSPTNGYPYLRTNEGQRQWVPRYHQSGAIVMPSYPAFDPGQVNVAYESGGWSAHSTEVARPLLQDLHPSRPRAVYVQPMVPRSSYEESHANMVPDFYPSFLHERPGFRRRMDSDGYEVVLPVGRHSTYRESSDMGVTFNRSRMHSEFGSRRPISSLDRADITRSEATRYGQGHVARRIEVYPHVLNDQEDFVTHRISTGYNGHSSYFTAFDGHGIGSRIMRL